MSSTKMGGKLAPLLLNPPPSPNSHHNSPDDVREHDTGRLLASATSARSPT